LTLLNLSNALTRIFFAILIRSQLAAHLCNEIFIFRILIIFSGEDVDNWVGGKGDKGGDGGGKAVDYAEDAVMLQMEDDEIEAEAADDEEDSSGPSGYDQIIIFAFKYFSDGSTDDEIAAEYQMMSNGVDNEFLGFEVPN